jgi:hypothetical protein
VCTILHERYGKPADSERAGDGRKNIRRSRGNCGFGLWDVSKGQHGRRKRDGDGECKHGTPTGGRQHIEETVGPNAEPYREQRKSHEEHALASEAIRQPSAHKHQCDVADVVGRDYP